MRRLQMQKVGFDSHIQNSDSMIKANKILELQVIADNQTRWNSTYLMLEWALKLHVWIDSFIHEHTDVGGYSLSAADILSKEEWQTLQTIRDLMFPFWLLTLKLQGNAPGGSNGAVWEILPAMEVLINRFEDASKIHTPRKSKFINASINNALIKLRQYYHLLDDSPVYAASLVLNPSIKERYFENKWVGGQEEWTPKTKEDIQAFWTTDYKDNCYRISISLYITTGMKSWILHIREVYLWSIGCLKYSWWIWRVLRSSSSAKRAP